MEGLTLAGRRDALALCEERKGPGKRDVNSGTRVEVGRWEMKRAGQLTGQAVHLILRTT
jgi:hypothetical protein